PGDQRAESRAGGGTGLRDQPGGRGGAVSSSGAQRRGARRVSLGDPAEAKTAGARASRRSVPGGKTAPVSTKPQAKSATSGDSLHLSPNAADFACGFALAAWMLTSTGPSAVFRSLLPRS